MVEGGRVVGGAPVNLLNPGFPSLTITGNFPGFKLETFPPKYFTFGHQTLGQLSLGPQLFLKQNLIF